jgi:gamma-glutamyltranspeptidase/glutathione hydrolase
MDMMQKTRGAIAAGNPKTAEAGIEMLRLGGNAFDAAVAAVLASCTTEATLTSLAGGGFLLAHTHRNENILFDFFTQTPGQKREAKTVDFYPVEVNFGSVIQEFHIGLGAIAVPGTAKGLFHVHQRLGRLPLKVIVEPAIHYARNGVLLDDFQAYCLDILKPILLSNPGSRQIFAPNGSLLQSGEKLMIPALADTLNYLVEEGIRGFYEGEIAHRFVQDCEQKGGYLTLEDLKTYQVIEREPLTTSYRGNTLLTNPPPSSGGSLIAFTLALLSHFNLPAIGHGTAEHLQILANAMRLTNRARKDGYDANLYQPDLVQHFLDAEHINQYVDQLAHTINKWGSTTHLSVIDGEGNAASVTSSNGEGSSYVIPGTGVMTNNMLGEADLHPNGFHQWQNDARISSMMAPTMLLKQAQPEIVLGSGGSNRIRTAILQVISNVIDFDMSVDAAVNRSRMHWEDDVLSLEPGFYNSEIRQNTFPFNGELVHWEDQNMFFGGVHTVIQYADGTIAGAGDRRRNGSVVTLLS